MSPWERYAQLLGSARIRERPLFPLPRPETELELQARWFAGDFGRTFTGTAGEIIEIVQFGTWNREAGPDFSDAVIRIDGEAVVRGSIEFEIAAANWEIHGHATNPAFEETVLHAFVEASGREFFTRTSSHRQVPQVQVDLATLPAGLTNPLPLARPGRCHAPLQNLEAEKISDILEAAADFRLRRKTERLQRLTELHGAEEAVYQELAAALGYKQNKLPFTLLAQRLPAKGLRSHLEDAEATLFGLAGFLSAPDLAGFESGTRRYLRVLWDKWWPRRTELERLILPTPTWCLHGSRPLNHPQRRLGALAAIVAQWPRLHHSLGATDLTAARHFFLALRHPYWSFHYTLTSAAAPSEMALVGESRITEILANVVVPFRQARNRESRLEYQQLPARLTNRRVETAASRLFGDDPRRAAFLRTGARQQGLLQIYEDFCLQDDSDCAQCPFPEQMQKWT